MTKQPKSERFGAVAAWWDRLAARERALVAALGATLIVCLLIGVGYIIRGGLDRRRAHIKELKDAINDIERGRDAVDRHKREAEELNAVIGTEAPVLATYLEGAAGKVGISIPESAERPDVTTPNKQFVEKSVDIKLRGVTLEQLANFLKTIEEQSQVVVVERLMIKTYFNQHERLDVELTVAAFQRAAAPAKKDEAEPAKKEKI
jgi:type II secretory pathway component PulM